MPLVPTKPRERSLWLLAAAIPLLFVSGCPQLASDDFTKADPLDAGGSGGSAGSDTDGTGGKGGTPPSIDLSTATQAAGGSATTSSTSQGGNQQDAGPTAGSGAGDTGEADVDTSTGSGTSTDTSGGSGGSVSTGGGTNTDTSGGTGGGGTNGENTTGGEPECVPEDEICDGLDNDCDDAVDQVEVCAGNWGCEGFAFDGRGYMFCARPARVDEARAECDGQGMTLVQIDSADENAALVAAADTGWGGGSDWGSTGGWGDQQQAFWTGGSDAETEADWIWTGSGAPFWHGAADGAPVDGAYENWGAGRPNEANDDPENCMVVYVVDGQDGDAATWNDLPCGDPYPFICESP